MKFLLPILLCGAVHAETAIDRLRLSVEAYLNRTDTALYERDQKLLAKRLEQKMRDSAMSEDAALHTMALDFLADEREHFKADPAKLEHAVVIRLAVRAAFYLRRGIVPKGWQEYEADIKRWSELLSEVK